MMKIKVKFLLPAIIIAFCLIIFGAFAVGGITLTQDNIYVDWTNASGLSDACYSNYTTVTTTAAGVVTVDNSTGISGISFSVYNSTHYHKNITYAGAGGEQVSYVFDTAGIAGGTYSGTFLVYDVADNQVNDTINVTIYVPRELSELITTPTIIKQNRGSTTTVNTTFEIQNIEDYDLIISDITTSLSVDGSGSEYMNFTTNLNATPIPSGTNETFYVYVELDTSKADTVGTYYGNIILETANGCGGQTYTIPVSVELTDTLDMTILDIYNITGSSDVGVPGANITIEISPEYWNGDLVLGLNETNFTITLLHFYNSLLPDVNDTATLTANSVTDGATYYTLTALAPANLYGGNYTVTVLATDGTLSGSDTYHNFTLEGSALVMSVNDCGGSSMTSIGVAKTCTYTITNYGYSPANAVNITYSTAGTPANCITPIPTSAQLGNIIGGAYDTSLLNATSATVGTCTVTGTGTAAAGAKWGVFSLGRYFTVALPSDDTTTTTTSSSETSVSAKVSKMTVSATTPITIEQGKSKIETITVENTGSYNLKDVTVSVTGIDSSWWSISGKQDIPVLDKTKTYELTLDVPEKGEPTSHTLTIKASGKDVNNKDVTASTTAILKVLPSEETQADIMANLTEYEDWYGDVMRMFNDTTLASENATKVESALEQVTGLLTKASSHVSLGEYFEAYDVLKQIRTLLTEAESDLGVEKGSFELIMFERFTVFASVMGVVVVMVILFFAHKSGKINLSKLKIPKIGNRRKSFGGKSSASLNFKRKKAGMKLKMEEFKQNVKKKKRNVKRGNFRIQLRGQGE